MRKYQHRVVAPVGRYIADWSECQDVAHGHFHPCLPRDREFPWRCPVLNLVASNRREYRQNYLASHNRRPPTDDIDIGDAEQFDSGTRLRDTDTPERELMRQELEQTVMKAVNALPEELRSAITLREVEGLSYEDIAQKMGCPIGTVRSRIFRAREAIDTELRPLLDIGSATREKSRV